MYINEPGLYKLIFRSKAKHAEVVTDWVCSEGLPSIRRTGSYVPKEKAMEEFGLIDTKRRCVPQLWMNR